ncbi:CBS domain-containing protein [Candidatus Woesearchaeota archaeon]|jgi:predicted transcriptional regulator|nr:CBS domain-containing protein [Candidatus Woesearchaeota archaeon]MBT4111051.1 CBS domain-containing protein [Candidatus Woesearchaeota archaeon]MBT4336920.1 CBS domain-containing protein [Candidatus Woesearchaeota archaeon]MBT4469765.1 CBS domain-containing protein [Candidatus Woesearchaeota archaeon]MBT6743764.1 CBS domain-containing protein [Candidatus Woesearchaeota archaeon]
MLEDLNEIKRIRKKHGLNQKELAEKADVSQSLIAKIESGKIEPSFSNAKKIFQALEELREKEELKAKNLMNKKIVFAKANDKVKDIIQVMKKKSISQIPVMNKNNICGLLTEGLILRKIAANPEAINQLTVEEIMEDAPPIVSIRTGLKVILELLKDNLIVLVAKKGDIKGIISKSDLLGKIE